MQEKKVLAIIVTYNSMKWAERCFTSLIMSLKRPDIYVVDNGSTDGTQDFIKAKYPGVIFFQCESNLGFGKANNLGIRYALEHKYDYVYLLNQDAWVYGDTLSKLIRVHQSHPEYGILSPMQIEANERHLDKNFMTNLCHNGKNVIDDIVFLEQGRVSQIDMVMAAHWLISRECLLKVGAFSPAFPHYCEDDNFADRAAYHGFKIGIVTDSFGVHDREFRRISHKQKIYEVYINSIMYVSFINRTIKHSILSSYYHLFAAVFINKSILPFVYLYRFTRDLPSILRYREMSKKTGAFI